MKSLSIRLGKGKVKLQKSDRLLGLKTMKSRSAEPIVPRGVEAATQPFAQHLGGFQIFDVGEATDTNEALDALRKEDEVEAGTHVYVAENGTTPLVPTGDIYINFEIGVDGEEQAIVLDEFHLRLVSRRDEYKVLATVTEKSMNPLKVAFFLEKCSLVESA